MSTRPRVLQELLTDLRTVRPGQRALVALDGVDGAGKTTIARELKHLAEEGSGSSTSPDGASARPLATISIDGFHHPREVRYADGTGPETFYRHSYDYAAFTDSVIEPFRRGAAIVPAVWDVDEDRPVSPDPLSLPADCVLLVEGIFLHRPELVSHWDASMWIDVPFEVSVPRGNERFPGWHAADPDDESNHRYVGGQRLYFAEAAPCEQATWIVDNRRLDRPTLSRQRS